MTRILLTGITGQVGQDLQQTLRSLGEVISIGRDAVGFLPTRSRSAMGRLR
ncbi:hypothetical protein [Kovacikia minuta]|uniref:hypothetical protein n=1 Tax=Kovacikia minuta TaxID=2931930 RepID=UPI0020C74F13